MKITFHIHELGRLKDTSFDLYPFLIFTGDSNLGKSYCAFLVYGFLKSLETELFSDFIAKLYDIPSLEKKVKAGEKVEIVFEMTQLESFFKENIQAILGSLIGYEEVNCKVGLEIKGYSIKFNCLLSKKDHSDLTFSGNNLHSFRNYSESLFDLKRYLAEEIIRRVHRQYSGDDYDKKVFIFPPARGTILSTTYSIQKEISANMRMYVEFLEDMDKLRQPNFGKTEINPEMMEKIKDILGGEIKTRQNEIYYHFENQSIPITAAASSIKELVPLFLLLKKYQSLAISLLYEEPESHLHPSMQKKLADLLAYMVNNGAYLQITTHSDYMLSEWNNLLRLAFIQKIDEKAFEKAVSETGIIPECALNPELVGAYYFQDTEDGVKMVKSDISATQQIQFGSFKDTINQMNDNRYILKDILADLNLEKHETAN